MSTTKQFLNVSNLVPLAIADLQADDASQNTTPGYVGYYQDNFGSRWLKYIRNQDGSAYTIGQVVGRVADITKTNPTQASSSTTYVTVTSTSLTVNNTCVGRLLIDEKDAAGTAPEGESGLIISNATSGSNTHLISIDTNLPFSATPGTTAALRIKTPGWHTRSAVASANAADVLGVVVAAGGITNTNYGWVQFQGACPRINCDPTLAHIVDHGIIMDTTAGLVVTDTTAAAKLTLGRCLATSTTNNSGFLPGILTLGVVGAGAVN